ncbi:MAG: DUF4395 family protein [Rhizobiales bacterium]|nr:DUF4395 domain-containing protein [Hyphomicrobiales bacterium]NRB13905.1 DUF4395 family protein [Hyphomicrobiales bacterium]
MSVFKNVICPISNQRVDGNINRLTVFLNAVFLALYLMTGMPIFMTIVAIDAGIKAIFPPIYSPVNWVSSRMAPLVKMPVKMVDEAPKIFAYRVGFLLALISLLLYQPYLAASYVLATNLLLLALLDSVFNFCVGCLTYHYIVFPLLGKNRS